MDLSNTLANIIKRNGTVAVNCLSGRGRTGTFMALILANLLQCKNNKDLINLIVNMRRYRDNMVETPKQFAFLSNVLGVNTFKNTIQIDVKNDKKSTGVASGLIVGLCLLIGVIILIIATFQRKTIGKKDDYLII